jgi:hypothetical protein
MQPLIYETRADNRKTQRRASDRMMRMQILFMLMLVALTGFMGGFYVAAAYGAHIALEASK